jgi:thiol-disulfide isomerase/thioredoxin
MDPSQLMNNPQVMQMLQDPEFMAMLQEPGMMERMQGLMSNPSAAMNDPQLMRLMSRMGGVGGMGGMDGMGGMGGRTPSAPAQPEEDMGLLQKVSSTAQYNYKVKDALAKQQPIVVDFTMQGCRPCAMLKPEIIKLSKENPDILFLLVDNRLCPEVVEDLAIQGFPTVLFYATTGQKLNKIDTVVGMNMGQIQANISRLQNELVLKKKQALFKPFKHMPLRENEITFFKQIQWDKVLSKASGILTSPDCSEQYYRPFTTSTNDQLDNFSSAKELLTHLTDFITFLQNFTTNSMSSIKPIYLKVLSILLEWPSDDLSVGFHIFRLAAFHNDFAAQIAKGGAKGPNHSNIIQRLCSLGSETSNSVGAVLVSRALCSCFDKKILTKSVLTSIDDLLGVITSLCITYQDDVNVITSTLALLLNTAFMVYSYSPTSVDNIEKQAVMVGYQKSILTTVIETLPLCIGNGTATNESQDATALYKVLIAMGTMLFSNYILVKTAVQDGKSVPRLEIKALFDELAGADQLQSWKDVYPNNPNIQAAIKEIEIILMELK